MPEDRTPDELAQLAKQIRRKVQDRLKTALSPAGGGTNAQAEGRTGSGENAPAESGTNAQAGGGANAQENSGAVGEAGVTVEMETESLSARGKISAEHAEVRWNLSLGPEPQKAPRSAEDSDNFWDLGAPKPRIYEKPSFRGRTVGPAEVSAPDPEPLPGERTAEAEKILRAGDGEPARAEPIAPRSAYQGSTGRVVNTAGGQRAVPTGQYATRSYRHGSSRPAKSPREADRTSKKSPGAAVVKTYRPEGSLIREIAVRTWETDTAFYNRFLTDALRSHGTKYPGDIRAKVPPKPVPYFSYVPQYAHMSLAQVTYYEYMRECVRNGLFPPCDFPYVLLYVYEILNLPDAIPPEEGVKLLAAVWLGYRKSWPRLDGYLCEWLPDYCMIHGLPLPDELAPILPEIVPKAQFKEFYLNRAAGGMLTRTVIETSSDYDFRSSRYYGDHKEAYEKHIPAAVSAALADEALERRGVFALDRVYRTTRDSFCGAIVASSVKRRLDIEFTSFTRRADVRPLTTALVKHSENRLRAVLGIKAKLGVSGISEEDVRAIDAYFAPLLPTKEQIRQKKEDAYMPADYLKQYESEDTGFDPGAAAEIEAQSWANTSRLTGEDYGGGESPLTGGESPLTGGESPLTEEDYGEPVPVEGEITDTAVGGDPVFAPLPGRDPAREPETTETAEISDEAGAPDAEDPALKDGLRAAMDGRFRAFCRDRGLYEGDLADRINGIFLEQIGDVVLEAAPDGGFRFIDDYREEAKEWLR